MVDRTGEVHRLDERHRRLVTQPGLVGLATLPRAERRLRHRVDQRRDLPALPVLLDPGADEVCEQPRQQVEGALAVVRDQRVQVDHERDAMRDPIGRARHRHPPEP